MQMSPEEYKNRKRELINAVISLKFFDRLVEAGILIRFLNEIWPLANMPSTDNRFKTLEGDITQHCVNNNDYEWTFLFSERLDLYKSEESFKKFINSMLDYSYYDTPAFQQKVAKVINDFLLRQGYELVCKNEINGFKNYEIRPVGSIEYNDISENTIPFYVDKVLLGRSDVRRYEYKDKANLLYPCFVLASYSWNDYSAVTQYHLFYYPSGEEKRVSIGKVKIIDNSPWEREDGWYYTDDNIDNGPFLKLPDNFCSLGQDESYYFRIKDEFGENYWPILNALKDGALFPKYYEDILMTPTSYSLTRDDIAERILREIRFKLEGRIIESRYHFDYLFKPHYSDEAITIPFRFDDDERKLYTHRIMVVIGKNGVGKTTMISSLPKAIGDSTKNVILPYKPLFSKIIAISSSVYDTFEMPLNSRGQEFIYCGMTRREKGQTFIASQDECVEHVKANLEIINKKERANSYLETLSSVVNINPGTFIRVDPNGKDIINIEKLTSFYNSASSGESVFIYNFSSVLANIRYDSLLVFDEPETHLHPNAISGLMSALYKLLEKYHSYAIIATHSALVVREVSADCVFIMTRDGNTPNIAKISKESLGGNVSVLVDEIFGDKEANMYYKEKLKSLAHNNWWSYDEAINYLQTEGVPLGLNLRLYLEAICKKNQDEED